MPSLVCSAKKVRPVLSDVSGGLELRQDDAVARALFADDMLQAGLLIGRYCLACGNSISVGRLAVCPRATRCSMCVEYKTLAKRR